MKDKEELIQHIAGRLRSHEGTYEQGAWEKFVEYEKKRKKKILPLFWAAAACVLVLLGVGVFYFLHEPTVSNQLLITGQNTSSQKDIEQIGNNDIKNNGARKSTNIPSETLAQNENRAQGQPPNDHINFSGNSSFVYFKSPVIGNNISLPKNYNTNTFYADIIKPAFAVPDTTINNSTANDVAFNQKINANTEVAQHNADSGKLTYFPKDAFDIPDENTAADFQRWTVDAVLSPSMSNNSNKVNMGYGVAFGYNVSKKVSVNSGASYLQLTGYNNTSSGGSSNIQANVTGINIPVELRYQLSKKIYVNAGASALAVLSNKQERNFIAANIQSDAFSAKNGFALSSSTALDKPVPKVNAASVPQSEVGNQNVAGFFNFSLGMKQKLGANTNFSVEPFVSVPMSGNFGKQNIHLTNAGIRIKFGL